MWKREKIAGIISRPGHQKIPPNSPPNGAPTGPPNGAPTGPPNGQFDCLFVVPFDCTPNGVSVWAAVMHSSKIMLDYRRWGLG